MVLCHEVPPLAVEVEVEPLLVLLLFETKVLPSILLSLYTGNSSSGFSAALGILRGFVILTCLVYSVQYPDTEYSNTGKLAEKAMKKEFDTSEKIKMAGKVISVDLFSKRRKKKGEIFTEKSK